MRSDRLKNTFLELIKTNITRKKSTVLKCTDFCILFVKSKKIRRNCIIYYLNSLNIFLWYTGMVQKPEGQVAETRKERDERRSSCGRGL